MMTMLSLNSVIQKPIQTRWSIVIHHGEASPLMHLVTGRGVVLPVNMLWSVAGVMSEITDVIKLNHFVLLLKQFVVPEMLAVVADADGANAQPDVSCISDAVNVEDRPVATDGHPLDGDFLSRSRYVSLLTDAVAALPGILSGVKEIYQFSFKIQCLFKHTSAVNKHKHVTTKCCAVNHKTSLLCRPLLPAQQLAVPSVPLRCITLHGYR